MWHKHSGVAASSLQLPVANVTATANKNEYSKIHIRVCILGCTLTSKGERFVNFHKTAMHQLKGMFQDWVPTQYVTDLIVKYMCVALHTVQLDVSLHSKSSDMYIYREVQP